MAAATLTLTLDPNEQAALQQLLDAALRHAGLGALETVAHFATKLAEERRRADPTSVSQPSCATR